MGRLIDADKVIKDMQYYHDDCAQTSEYTRLGFETAIEVVKSASTVLTIPDNPTNGDMIKALYPQYEIAIDDILGTVTLFVIENGSAWLLNYDLDWWNAPWKRGNENG